MNRVIFILLVSITLLNCSGDSSSELIVENKKPVAVDDEYILTKNTDLLIDDLLSNDTVITGAKITTFESNSTNNGSIVDNSNGTYSYTPPSNFIGDDTFEYTLCNNNENPDCSTATVTITIFEPVSFNIPTDLSSYYSTLSVTTESDLNYTSISDHTSDKHTTILSYGERHGFLYDADEDTANKANVILMYTSESRDEREYTSGNNSHSPQTFNTEHVYPQSRLEAANAVTDLHHLRSCDADVNSNRSNFPFVDGSGSNQLVDGNTWYPGDDWRGDVARMIMYLNVRYGETFEKVGTLDLFLEWNAADPVSDFELQRNAIIQGAQGNRNPFIDNPYIATLIWGGTPAENRWE